MIFLLSSQMELLFASSLLKLVRMGVKMSGPRFIKSALDPTWGTYLGTSSLRVKVEYKAVTLATYTVEVEDDHRHLRQVSHPRLVETPFRSPQLTRLHLRPR
jgi:hypothetical protein